MSLTPWRPVQLVRPRPDARHQASLLAHYRATPPAEQAALRDMCFRQWALRDGNDPWGIWAGGVYDEMERLRREAAGRQL
jgi:hypothetical protein